MASPFLAQIRIFAGNFAPRGNARCDGQILPIAQNTAVFSLLGTTYGGNGQTTFALPDLRDRVPMHTGNGPGLTQRFLGEAGGTSTVTLISAELPSHNHLANASATAGTDSSPTNENFGAGGGRGRPSIYTATAPTIPMAPASAAGGNQPHNNLQPYLGLTFIIALQGVFPARN